MKRDIYLKLIALFFCAFVSNMVQAQATGSYDDSVTFIGKYRKLSLYVPPSYSPSIPCNLMVCLHGLGDNCANYRNGVISGLSWNTLFPNTIFICPEALTTTSDFLLPAGNEAIIQVCIDYVKAKYEIDTTQIILEGFSYGGRSALKFGLEHYTKFKGLLLNTPALQGVKDAVNGHSAYTFSYANSAHIPIYMTHGMDDIAYEGPVDSVFDLMVQNDGLVKYLNIPGMGHALPSVSKIADVLQFFQSPATPGYDLDVVKNVVAQRSCVAAVPAACVVRNTGANTINSVALSYKVDGVVSTYTWTGALPSFKHAQISLPALSVADGNHVLDVSVSKIDTTVTDTITANNEQSSNFMVQTSGITLPISEGFDGPSFPPANWVQYLAGDFYSPWFIDSTVKKKGVASMGAFNTPLYFDNQGRREEIVTPVLNLSSISKPHLSFDVAFNYDAFTPPYTLMDTAWSDTLEVLISTDCGDTYHSLYKKSGSDLATYKNPLLNVVSIADEFITPADSNWRTEYIDLSSYSSYDKAIIKFSYISGLGGSIYVDDVDITNAPVNVANIATGEFNIYPNPASNVINIMSGKGLINKVSVVDVTGKVVLTVDNSNQNNMLPINTTSLEDGFYIIQLFSDKDVKTQKILIKH